MKKYRKNGFTLAELIVVLVILAILLALAVPAAMRYMRLAEFRKNESNAKTAYLAAESMLTWYRASGSWDEFEREVRAQGTLNETFAPGDEREGRIYAVTLHNSASLKDDGWLVERLLADSALDGSTMAATIAIEIDIETGQVYSAFYGTHCKGLSYEESADADVLNISAADDNRAYESRREILLGYYSVEDVANVVELKPVRLKVTNVTLVNSETLSLNWSGNSRHDNLDVIYDITFYQTAEGEGSADTALFSVSVDGWDLRADGGGGFAELELKGPASADGSAVSYGTWNFPLSYQNGRFSLVLDAMMSADLLESLEAKGQAAAAGADASAWNAWLDFLQQYGTSITRFTQAREGGAPAANLQGLAKPQDIYAVVTARPAKNVNGDVTEYQASAPAKSNTENTLFAAGSKITADAGLEAEISRYRHLSNIRYMAETAGGRAVFSLTARNMDWTAAGTGLYGLTAAGAGATASLAWQSASSGTVDFPSIPLLAKEQTLTGALSGTDVALLSNLRLGNGSMPDDNWVKNARTSSETTGSVAGEGDYTRYVGLFCEIEGTVRSLTFSNPRLCLNAGTQAAGAVEFAYLYGAGILCGRGAGTLSDIAVRSSGQDTEKAALVQVRFTDKETGTGSRDLRPAGIGGLIGVLAAEQTDGTLAAITGVELENLTMAGLVEGTLPKPAGLGGADGSRVLEYVQEEAVKYACGIGGIVGYGILGKNESGNTGVKLVNCQNHAEVRGNLFTGGIGGRLNGVYEQASDGSQAKYVSMENCFNDGLVLCTKKHEDEERELEGRYFGGLLGFGQQIWIAESSSASGRAAGFSYTKDNDYDKLLGQYVGGIIGYGTACYISGCHTQSGGYILGSDYVGGIAGGLANVVQEVIGAGQQEGGIQVTTNAGYVIGYNYVGGIVGKNGETVAEGDTESTDTVKTVIENCVNNGVAAGYGRYIGGIVGYNGSNGRLVDCASYLSDYSGAVFNRIVKDWQATGNCVGGLAGYNNGEIKFGTPDSITIKSVSSVVVGNHYVGGMIGFNDEAGTFDVKYTLIGGRVYGYGDGVGGCIGLNASQKVLEQELSVRPSSVTGRYYVGGVIGANVVDLQAQTGKNAVIAAGLEADNRLGSISGAAFVGGVIGYHRTHSNDQMNELLQNAGQESMLDYLLLAYDTQKADSYRPLLPGLTNENLPEKVEESKNLTCLLLTCGKNTYDDLAVSSNTIPIRALAYTGGIVGCSEQQSRLVLKDCKNTGSISRLAPDADATEEQKELVEQVGKGISLTGYLQYAGLSASQAADLEDVTIFLVGGMISANLENQVIDHCSNTGSMTGFVGLGGIVGFNGGLVTRCELQDNFGSANLDYLGGIAGLNVQLSENATPPTSDYKDSFASGVIDSCTTQAGSTVSGRSYVGGIAGYNMTGAVLKNNTSYVNITAAGDYAGGIAGGNAGRIEMAADAGTSTRTIRGTGSGETGGVGIGGIVGWNKTGGTIVIKGASAGTNVIAVNASVSIVGRERVGGIVGIHNGTLTMEDGGTIVCAANQVRALAGYAGGIAGEASGPITSAWNRCQEVTADRGPAGGIVALNQPGCTLSKCVSAGGSVQSDQGYAGGIAAQNYGTITECTVGNQADGLEIRSQGIEQEGDVRAIGAICALNAVGGVVEESGLSAQSGKIRLTGEADYVGGAAGLNQGTIRDMTMEGTPDIAITTPALMVGAVAGRNEKAKPDDAASGMIANVTVSKAEFTNFNNYRYLGGITGQNGEDACVQNCSFINGTIQETGGSAAGNCYGGIAGENRGILEDCTIRSIRMEVTGVYTATSTSTTNEKEQKSSHAGGVTGKNEETGVITGCLIENALNGGNASEIQVESGMAGGIAGYNKGQIELSGDAVTEKLMAINEGGTIAELLKLAEAENLAADENLVLYGTAPKGLENLRYNGTNVSITADRSLRLIMSTNGNIGGITAYNAPSGRVDYCATGNWYLNNQSAAIGVGTGGIIGMNESNHDLSFLVNRAFVGRELMDGKTNTNRFVGGIIGNQNNSTAEGWKIRYCLNYGTVYGFNTHYSGGILGQWTGTGGTIESCYNYGILQTTHYQDWLGAAGGIVAQLYHARENNTYNIISCRNYGSIYGREEKDHARDCASDSAGILGNVTAYNVAKGSRGQHFTIQVLDCVNEPGVEIYSASMASGIVGFFSCDEPGGSGENIPDAVKYIDLRIERCRNFAAKLYGGAENKFSAGILGDKYDSESGHTILQDCYSVVRGEDDYFAHGYPIISYHNTSYSKADWIESIKRYENTSNYFLGGTESGLTDVNSFRFESVTTTTAYKLTDNLQRASTGLFYSLTQNGKQYFVFLKDGTSINRFYSLSVNDATGKVYRNNTEVGYLLFTVDNSKAGKVGDYNSIAKICAKNSGFDEYVREAYRRLEGPYGKDASGNSQMAAPEAVKLIRDGNQLQITVTPETGSDPFRYTAELYIVEDGQETLLASDIEFYDETYHLTLSSKDAALPGTLVIKVRACSMYDDVAPSESTDSTQGEVNKEMLPAPDLRIELVGNGDAMDSYIYRLRLVNIADFVALDPNDYYISVNRLAGEALELAAGTDGILMLRNNPAQTASLTPSASLDQLLVQTKPEIAIANTYADSSQVSVPVYLPGYSPSISLGKKPDDGVAEVTCKLEGTSLSDLRITVTLETGNGNVTTAPVYRAELVGTWKAEDGSEFTNVTFATQDILTASNGAAAATFANLPETLAQASDLCIRVWYVNSGLGPVYSWYPVETDPTGGFRILDLETNTWICGESRVLSDKTFENYRQTYPQTGDALLTWLSAPKLMTVTDSLPPLLTADNRLQYEFRWDEGPGEYQAGQKYRVTLTGIREDKTRVSIVTNQEVTDNSLQADAENWNYTRVELSVTRVGSGNQIGLTSVKEYSVRQRLPQPAQPTVKNTKPDELYYTVSWSPVTPEATGDSPQGCIGYQIYVRPYDLMTGGWGNPVAVGELSAGQTIYEKSDVDLEAYAGQRVIVYVVAKAADHDPAYVDSVDGITYELTVPNRIDKPAVDWTKSWTYDINQPITMEEFRSSRLQVSVKNTGDPIPGDSSYLLKGYVFDTEADAQAAQAQWTSTGTAPAVGTDAGNAQVSYPFAEAGNEVIPAAMAVVSGTEYTHILNGLSPRYAGKWIVFGTRISTGGGQVSSPWTANSAVWQLPAVRLDAPDVTIASQERQVSVSCKENPDLDWPDEKETWTTNQRVLSWRHTELADSSEIELVKTDGTKAVFRVEENTDGIVNVFGRTEEADGTISWEPLPVQAEADGTFGCELSAYTMEVENLYQKQGRNIYYRLQCAARLELSRNDEGTLACTLILPDTDSLQDADGISIADQTTTNAAFLPTQSVSTRCDVTANGPGSGAASDAYAASEATTITFGN